MKKKKQFIKFLALMLAVLIILPLVPAYKAKAYDQKSFTTALEAGYGGNIKLGYYAPFKITIKNNDKDFAGYVQLIVPGFKGENNMYQTMVNIPSGESSVITFCAPVENSLGCVEIRCADKKGKVVWSEQKLTNVVHSGNTINVGVFSDDFAALGYMDKQELFSDVSLQTSIFQLDQNSLTNDWFTLDMLDIIVISDFSTDLFTDKQVSALEGWVNNGGLLMIGTGATSSKTLSGLEGNIIRTQNGVMRSYNTRLGLSYIDFNALYYQSQNAYQGTGWWQDDAEYVTWLNDNFEANRQEFVDAYADDFMDIYGLDVEEEYDPSTGTLPVNSEIRNTGDQSLIDAYVDMAENSYDVWFREYVGEEFYDYWLTSIKAGQNEIINVEDYPYIFTDTLSIGLEGYHYTIDGDTEAGIPYTLAQVRKVGDGYICLTAVDFTKNPIPSYSGAGYFFMALVDEIAGDNIVQNARDYESNIDRGNILLNTYAAYAPDYVDDNSGAPLPPVLIYLLILWGYLVSLIVMYTVFKKKKKVFNLWFVYPAVAVGVGLLIFCLGFSSRIYKPVIKTTALVTLEDGKMYEEQFATVITPSRKAYKIAFSGDYTSSKINDSYYYSYYSDPVDISTYTYVHTITPEGIEDSYSLAPLESTGLYLSKSEPTDKDITFIDGVLTNNTGITLENSILARGSELFPSSYSTINARMYDVASLAPGESFDVRTVSKYEMSKYNSLGQQVESLPSHDIVGPTISGLCFGSRSSAYSDMVAQRFILDNIESTLVVGPNDYVFIGFPKENISGNALISKSCHEEKRDVVVKIFRAGEY